MPYFYPASLHPKFARALVNLSRVRANQKLLDPFCGTGAILAEGALVGLRTVGTDISEKMIDGARENLDHLHLEADLIRCDVGDIAKAVGHVSGIATDPPYGKSTSTQGEKIPELYERAFESFSEVLDEGAVVAMVVPNTSLLESADEFEPASVGAAATAWPSSGSTDGATQDGGCPMPRAKRQDQRERYTVLKGMLEDRRCEIQAKLRSLRETLPAELAEVKDSEEQSVHDFVQDVEMALMEMKSATLAKIDEAVRRLENGSYGACTESGTDISEARLKALPFAAMCRPCQEREEESKIQTDNRAIKEFAPPLR